MRTHYDNLKVARDAPIEVIAASYRALAKKHHPDRNGSDADATRILQVINDSYTVLSDPALRAEYDTWISVHQEKGDENYGQTSFASPGSASPSHARPLPYTPLKSKAAEWALWLGLASVVFVPVALGAVICGHKALKEIANSHGTLAGEGYAKAGLTLGYFYLALTILVLLVGLFQA